MMKTFRLIGALALCAAFIPSFTACIGDDDDDMPGGNTGAGTVIDGYRLASAGGYKFTYDDKGRLTRISSPYGDEGITIDYGKGTMTDNNDNESTEYKVRFNKLGFISELSGTWDYIDEDGSYGSRVKGNGKIKFDYNGDGNLIAISSSMSETEEDLEEGYIEKKTEKTDVDYTWKEGNMVAAVEKYSEIEDDDNRYDWTMTYDMEYGSMENKFYQTTFALSYIGLGDIEWQALGVAGLAGKGTAMLPSSLTETDDDRTGASDTESISYTLNTNGSIASEISNYQSYYYTYTEARSAMDVADEPVKPLRLHNLFTRRHARK